MKQRDRRALYLLAAAIGAMLIWRFSSGESSATAVVPAVASLPLAQKRLARAKEVAASVPGKQAVLKQVDTQLADRERGVISVETAAQARARLLETARRLGKAEGIDVRGGDFAAPRPFGNDYGQVLVTVSFEAHIEQFLNFLAALSKEQDLIAPEETRISAGNAKEKTMLVRMSLAGIVPRKLVPTEKKGLASF